MNELLFERALGLEICEEALGVGLVGGVVFRGQDNDVSGESVAKGVERRTLFAGVGAGARGVQRVGPVDYGAVVLLGVDRG